MSDVTTVSNKTTKYTFCISIEDDVSVVLKVENLVMHPLYQRFVRTTSKFMAQADTSLLRALNYILFEDGRPMSRRKRWRVRRVIERAK